MGDPTFSLDPGRFRLLDETLQLDPELERDLRRLTEGLATPRVVNLFVRPDWNRLRQEQLNRLLTQAPAARPANRPANRPSPALRAADVGDLLQAIWALQQVQQIAQRALDQARRNAQREWRGAGTGERAAMIGSAGFVAATAMTAILANRPTRAAALDFLDGRMIGVPGVRGLGVELRGRGRGAGARLSDIGGSGVSVRGGAQAGAGASVDWDINISVDLTRLIPELR